MEPLSPRRAVRGALASAALALIWIAAGDHAWGQAPLGPSATLERAASLIEARAFDRAAAVLRELLSADPEDRRAKELLAFALESSGDLAGERKVRASLAAAFPGDARIQTDYGRVLERAGDERGALAAYLRARALSPDRRHPDLDAAIDRMKGRSAVEVGTPLVVLSDPEASASRVQAGAAIPFG